MSALDPERVEYIRYAQISEGRRSAPVQIEGRQGVSWRSTSTATTTAAADPGRRRPIPKAQPTSISAPFPWTALAGRMSSIRSWRSCGSLSSAGACMDVRENAIAVEFKGRCAKVRSEMVQVADRIGASEGARTLDLRRDRPAL